MERLEVASCAGRKGHLKMANQKVTKTSRVAASRGNSRRASNSITNNRDSRFLVLVGIMAVALVSTIGVAVAAFTQDLKIQGTATVKGTSWDIHFENLIATPTIISSLNTAKEITKPSIDGTNTIISNYAVELKSDGDAITYTFDVKNDGDIDAMVTGVTMKTGSTLICNSTGGTAAEQTTRNSNTCANLDYTLTYADGSSVQLNDQLPKHSAKTMNLKLEYKAKGPSGTGTEYYPDADVTVSGLDVTITYGQLTN